MWNDTVLEDRLIAKADHVEAHLIDVPDKHDAKAGLATLEEYAQLDNLNAPGFTIAAGKATFEGEVSNAAATMCGPMAIADLLMRWQTGRRHVHAYATSRARTARAFRRDRQPLARRRRAGCRGR